MSKYVPYSTEYIVPNSNIPVSTLRGTWYVAMLENFVGGRRNDSKRTYTVVVGEERRGYVTRLSPVLKRVAPDRKLQYLILLCVTSVYIYLDSKSKTMNSALVEPGLLSEMLVPGAILRYAPSPSLNSTCCSSASFVKTAFRLAPLASPTL